MSDEAQKLRAGQAAADYVLRAVSSANLALEGDFALGLVFLALIQANARPWPADAPPRPVSCDCNRRPISGGALATSLQLPAETVRRKVKTLIALGYVRRVDAGLMVPSEALARPEVVRLIRANYVHLRRLFGQLRRCGVDLTPRSGRTGRNGPQPEDA